MFCFLDLDIHFSLTVHPYEHNEVDIDSDSIDTTDGISDTSSINQSENDDFELEMILDLNIDDQNTYHADESNSDDDLSSDTNSDTNDEDREDLHGGIANGFNRMYDDDGWSIITHLTDEWSEDDEEIDIDEGYETKSENDSLIDEEERMLFEI